MIGIASYLFFIGLVWWRARCRGAVCIYGLISWSDLFVDYTCLSHVSFTFTTRFASDLQGCSSFSCQTFSSFKPWLQFQLHKLSLPVPSHIPGTIYSQRHTQLYNASGKGQISNVSVKPKPLE